MGLRTSTGLDGWCVADLLYLPNVLLNWLAELLTVIEQTGRWPRILARGFISLIPKGEGMLPMQQRPVSVLSQIYRVWAGVRLEECMTWQETWIHPQAYGFRKKRGATDAAGMISLLIELCHVMQTTLMGFWLDYVKCFDLIPRQVVLLVAKEEGMDEGVHRALSGMYAQLMRCFKIMACMCSFFQATNGILQGCPLSVILINLLTSIWKRVMDAQAQAIQAQAIQVSTNRMPPGGSPKEALSFIITALGYADDTYGLGTVRPRTQRPLERTQQWMIDIRQAVNPLKSVSFQVGLADKDPLRMGREPFPISTEFKSLGAGVRTTGDPSSGPLILQRIARASKLLDRVHGAQGHFERRCSVVSTMITAAGLHAAEIVPLQPKSLSSFETKIITTIWGPSRPARAKEIVFCLLCAGHRIAPTLIIPYQRALWLAKLCRTRGPSLVLAQAIWEKNPSPQSAGPFGRALQTLHNWGWTPAQGWWEWTAPGVAQPLSLIGDKAEVKHHVREQLRAQLIAQLIQRRPRQFTGMHYTTNKRLVPQSILSFTSELERSLLRTILAGGVWTALRAHQRGLRPSSNCPFCGKAAETEQHIFWSCEAG